MLYFFKLICALLAIVVTAEPTVLAFQKNYPALGRSRFPPKAPGKAAPPCTFRDAVLLQKGKSNRDEKVAELRTANYTKVEDGSPLGVAIVVLGGSLVVFGGDELSKIPVWAVFVTASVAAGLSRLVRFLRDK
jgi:hypothetical protein